MAYIQTITNQYIGALAIYCHTGVNIWKDTDYIKTFPFLRSSKLLNHIAGRTYPSTTTPLAGWLFAHLVPKEHCPHPPKKKSGDFEITKILVCVFETKLCSIKKLSKNVIKRKTLAKIKPAQLV